MLQFGVSVLLLTYLPTTVATTCADCKTTYTADKAPATGNPAKCVVLAAYLTCLETSGKTDAGCPLATADAAAIEADYNDLSCSGEAVFTATCKCQKDFWKTDQSAGASAVCSAYNNELSCLRTAQAASCDGTTTKSSVATATYTARAALATDCAAPTATCDCEIAAAKGNAASATAYCTVLSTLKTCLNAITTDTEAGCTSTTKAALVTDTDTKITAATWGSAADHVTLAMTSLIVSIVVHLFL